MTACSRTFSRCRRSRRGSIVRAIAPQILDAETAKVGRRRPDSLSAYEVAVRAHGKTFEAWVKSDRALQDAAIADAFQALTIDPRSVVALTALAFGHWQHIAFSTTADRPASWRDAMAAVDRAIEVDRDYSFAHSVRGLLLAFATDRDRIGDALASARQSCELNPNLMVGLTILSFIEVVSGGPRQRHRASAGGVATQPARSAALDDDAEPRDGLRLRPPLCRRRGLC